MAKIKYVRRPCGGGTGIERDRRAGGLVQGPVVQGPRPAWAAKRVAAVRRGAVPAGAAGTRCTHTQRCARHIAKNNKKKKTVTCARARVGEKTKKKQSGGKGAEKMKRRQSVEE